MWCLLNANPRISLSASVSPEGSTEQQQGDSHGTVVVMCTHLHSWQWGQQSDAAMASLKLSPSIPWRGGRSAGGRKQRPHKLKFFSGLFLTEFYWCVSFLSFFDGNIYGGLQQQLTPRPCRQTPTTPTRHSYIICIPSPIKHVKMSPH